jgi:hypothetical protein
VEVAQCASDQCVRVRRAAMQRLNSSVTSVVALLLELDDLLMRVLKHGVFSTDADTVFFVFLCRWEHTFDGRRMDFSTDAGMSKKPGGGGGAYRLT